MSSMASESDNEMSEEQCRETDRAQKRTREDSEGEWTTVGQSKDKKMKDTEKIELYISSKEKLPKQFALAGIFREQNISDIFRVKYINPFKVRVDVISELSVKKLETCQEFKNRNWLIYKPMERNYSYGVIKDVDLELSNENILEKISCSKPAQLISANRLNRKKSNEIGWIPSETVRLCFKGTFIPAYVYVDEMRVQVDKYEFPVSQCSICWKFGHIKTRCTSKIVCPKCGKNHENCESTHFKCANCSGKHMALSKACPLFSKEKKLRTLMSELNCTYRKALELYVPPEPPNQNKEREEENSEADISDEEDKAQQYPPTSSCSRDDTTQYKHAPTYADMTKKASSHNKLKRTKNQQKSYTRTQHIDPNFEDTEETEDRDLNNKSREKDFNIGELLRRLQEIIFLRGATMQSKVIAAVKCCVEWTILAFVNNISDWPILEVLLGFLKNDDGQERK